MSKFFDDDGSRHAQHRRGDIPHFDRNASHPEVRRVVHYHCPEDRSHLANLSRRFRSRKS